MDGQKIINENEVIKIFDPVNNTIAGKNIYNFNSNIDSWLVYFVYGDLENNIDIICRNMKIFFSFLIAEIAKSNPSILKQAIVDPITGLLVFGEDGIVKEINVNNLLHSFPGYINLTKNNINNIFKSLEKVEALDNVKKNRFSLFADFFISSLNTRKEERVIKQFIAIDALWGEEGKSQESIIKGIISVIGEKNKNVRKSEKLYKLRCELLHGGCSTIDEWNNYDKYIKEFKTEPENDLMNIFLTTIRAYGD